jgi:hypothetical protein
MAARTLNDFLNEELPRYEDPNARWVPARAYLKEPGFALLYVRISMRIIKGVRFLPVLDIANVEALEKSKGTFTNLVKSVRAKYPSLPILVESVISERFVKRLERMGFENIGPGVSMSMFLYPHHEIRDV